MTPVGLFLAGWPLSASLLSALYAASGGRATRRPSTPAGRRVLVLFAVLYAVLAPGAWRSGC